MCSHCWDAHSVPPHNGCEHKRHCLFCPFTILPEKTIVGAFSVIVKYLQTFVWSSSDKKGCSLRTTLSLSTSWIVARHIPLRRGGQCGATPAATKWSHSLWGATSHAPGHSQPVRSYLVRGYIFGYLVVFECCILRCFCIIQSSNLLN